MLGPQCAIGSTKSPTWHRRLRAKRAKARSRIRRAKALGSTLPRPAVALLEAHHSQPHYLPKPMGKDKWGKERGGQWQDGSSSQRWSAKQWQNWEKEKNKQAQSAQQPQATSFPGYQSVQLPAEDGGKDAEPRRCDPCHRQGSGAADQGAATCSQQFPQARQQATQIGRGQGSQDRSVAALSAAAEGNVPPAVSQLQRGPQQDRRGDSCRPGPPDYREGHVGPYCGRQGPPACGDTCFGIGAYLLGDCGPGHALQHRWCLGCGHGRPQDWGRRLEPAVNAAVSSEHEGGARHQGGASALSNPGHAERDPGHEGDLYRSGWSGRLSHPSSTTNTGVPGHAAQTPFFFCLGRPRSYRTCATACSLWSGPIPACAGGSGGPFQFLSQRPGGQAVGWQDCYYQETYTPRSAPRSLSQARSEPYRAHPAGSLLEKLHVQHQDINNKATIPSTGEPPPK